MDMILSLGDKYLVCDARHPIISGHSLSEELLLYNLDHQSTAQLLDDYHLLTGKRLSPASHPDQLSGGQKVILMAFLALYSPAPRLAFIDLYHNLDERSGAKLSEALADSSKDILLVASDAI